MNVDFQTEKQLQRLSGEIKSANKELDAEKNAFADFLDNYGQAMLEQLEKPKKTSIINGLMNRFKRWITIRKCKKNEKMIKKLIYEHEEFDKDIKTNFYD